jgi:hypothetical protein
MSDGSQVRELSYCYNDPVFPLPQTGDYRILFDPSGQDHSLGFALLPAKDPLIDPGLRPEQVSIEFGSFNRGDQIKLSPYCVKDYLPANLALTNDQIWVRIMQVDGYERFYSPFSRISELQASLRPRTKALDARNMPRPNDARGVAIVMTVRAELINGESWRGWRWIEGTSGKEYPEKLTYVFQGISNDGRFLFVLRAPISHPELARPSTGDKTPNEATGVGARLRLEQRLANVGSASFQPSLDRLDSVIRSLKIKK